MEQIQDIRAFVAVVDHGSQTAAARHLGRSVQSVSRSLAALERSLGVQLVQRTTRQSAATDVGLAYHRGMRAMLAEYDSARLEATSQQAAPKGVLRIAAPVQFAPVFVVPLVAGFMARHPGLDVELTTSDRFTDLIDGHLDLAIRIGDLPDSDLAARRLGAVRRVVVGAPAYFARHGTPQRPADLVAHQCLVRTTHDDAARWPFQVGGRSQRVAVAGRFRSDSTAALYAAVTEGLGLCFTPRWQVRALIDRGDVAEVLTRFEAPPLPVHAVWPAARGSVARGKLFAAYAAENWPDGVG